MEIIGLICEYNPFHNGHLYHIKTIKKKYPNSLLVLCLNGYFLERGEVSILSKEEKTKIALKNNIDLVIELPSLYGCQSADNFAMCAVTLLNALNVKKIIFGSESNNIDLLKEYAKKQISLSNTKLKNELNNGTSYQKSLFNLLKIDHIPSNDLLGISYCKAVIKNKYNIELETIKRTNGYNDLSLDKEIVSANNIRNKLRLKENIQKYLPDYVLNKIILPDEEKFWTLLKYQIINNNNLESILDVKEGIHNKIKKDIFTVTNYKELVNKIKSKRYPLNYVNRLLMHIFLSLEKKHCQENINYIHILGFNEKGQKYLKEERKNISLPLRPIKNTYCYEFELKCSFLYDMLTGNSTYQFEKQNKPIYINTASLTNEESQK